MKLHKCAQLCRQVSRVYTNMSREQNLANYFTRVMLHRYIGLVIAQHPVYVISKHSSPLRTMPSLPQFFHVIIEVSHSCRQASVFPNGQFSTLSKNYNYPTAEERGYSPRETGPHQIPDQTIIDKKLRLEVEKVKFMFSVWLKRKHYIGSKS